VVGLAVSHLDETGTGRWPSSNQKRSLPGIAPVLACSGPGRFGAANPGWPVISREVRGLIPKMCRENPYWGAPRIHGELLKLGIDIGESSVSKYMVHGRKPPSQTWRTFLENHAQNLSRSTSSLCPPSVSRCFTCSWYWPMTAVALFTSM
jgi:hypothetical protein